MAEERQLAMPLLMSQRSIQHHITSALYLCYTWRLLVRHMNNRRTWRDDEATALHKTLFPQFPFCLPRWL